MSLVRGLANAYIDGEGEEEVSRENASARTAIPLARVIELEELLDGQYHHTGISFTERGGRPRAFGLLQQVIKWKACDGYAAYAAERDAPVAAPGLPPPFDEEARSPRRPLVLKGHQRALDAALRRKSSDLSRYYLGALIVLADEANPDRIALAAHGLREMIEKLPNFIDVFMPAHAESMGVKVNELQNRWQRAMKKTQSLVNGTWEGEIDQHLVSALNAIAEFFSWKTDHNPRRRDEIGQTLTQLDPSRRALPAQLQDLNIEHWKQLREFFVRVAHHATCTFEELTKWLDALERFLLERLSPRTFEDHSAIDSILGIDSGQTP